MKCLIFAFLLLSAFAFSQKVFDVVELSNGEVIVVYDDKTWGYPTDVKKSKPATIQGFVSPTTPPSNSTTSSSNTTAKPAATTTPTRAVSSSSSTSSQCTSTTQKGLRCKRMVRGGGRCYQH